MHGKKSNRAYGRKGLKNEQKKNIFQFFVRDEWKTSMKCSHSSTSKEYILLFCRHGNIFNLLNVWEDNFYPYIALSHPPFSLFIFCVLHFAITFARMCSFFPTLLQWFVFHSFVSCQRKVVLFVQSWEDKIEIRFCVPSPLPFWKTIPSHSAMRRHS